MGCYVVVAELRIRKREQAVRTSTGGNKEEIITPRNASENAGFL